MHAWNETPRDDIADLLDGAAALAARAARLRRLGQIDQAAISEVALGEHLRTIRHERARAERLAPSPRTRQRPGRRTGPGGKENRCKT